MKLRNLSQLLLAGSIAFAATSCDKDETEEVVKPEERVYTIGYAVGSGNPSSSYVQGLTDLSSGEISFVNFGFEVPSTRTARIFTSDDGRTLYSLDYGGGSIYKFDVYNGQEYTLLAETNVQFAIGTAFPRWTKINDDVAMLHTVSTEHQYNEQNEYTHTVATARVMSVNLSNLTINKIEEFEIPITEEMESTGDFVFRIDAPIVMGDKVFYGMAKRRYDPSTDENIDAAYLNVETMVLDYPNLTNPRIISTSANGARGATNGYRTSVSYEDERGDVYQIVTVPNNTFDTHILKIDGEGYDESFQFNLSDLLGENTISNGWFYVGDGIGYVPYANSDMGATSEPVWSVARVDIYNGTAVKLETPSNLWLQQYQNAVTIDGKFQMVLAPLGGQGYVYSFDVSSASSNAFTIGANVDASADSYYIGIY